MVALELADVPLLSQQRKSRGAAFHSCLQIITSNNNKKLSASEKESL